MPSCAVCSGMSLLGQGAGTKTSNPTHNLWFCGFVFGFYYRLLNGIDIPSL